MQKAPDPLLSPLEAPPNGAGNAESQYAYRLMKTHPDWQVLNRGVNGERSDQIRARFARDVIAERRNGRPPCLVVIIAGVNDIYQGRTAEAIEGELEGMYDAARAAAIPVVAGTIIPYNTAADAENRRMHPSPDGYRLMALALEAAIKRALAAAHPLR